LLNDWWDKQIERARELSAQSEGSRDLLVFYAHLLHVQKKIYEFLAGHNGWAPTGNLHNDLPVILKTLPELLRTIEEHGPELLAAEAHALSNESPERIHRIFISFWESRSDVQFFPKAAFQPYLRAVLDRGVTLSGDDSLASERSCPFCGGHPQVSFLQSREPSAESGNRDLLCANCLSTWQFRRVVCAHCGEERPAKLAYFSSPEFDHVRIEACDTCKHYLKGIDLTRVGFAAPLVDEVYAAPLDLWAREHGYTKIELNLLGV
jgi:formate dehydrogenase accessory protein FdhE